MAEADSTTNSKLHIVMFPWLAMGHFIPFLELSKSLASKGHHISFLSTPRNIQRLPKLPPNLSPLITLVNLPFPTIENLPKNAQSSTDIPIQKTQLLKRAFDKLEPHVTKYLENSRTPIDYIIYDYASYWIPPIGAKLNIPCVYFNVFTAAAISFFGPPSALINIGDRVTAEAYTTVPKWIPFSSNIVYRLHEVLQYFQGAPGDDADISDVPDTYRFGVSIRDCEFMAIRSCVEFEPEWISFLSELDKKSVIPVGSLHPSVHVSMDEDVDEDERWVSIREWLDKHRVESVIYVALGTEAVLSESQLNELALGLERSELPFFWVLRAPPESNVDVLAMLPNGFVDRVKNRGVVWTSWAPQVKILGHQSVGGFVTHCGWNSLIEGLGFGIVPLLLPMLNDQGLNARLVEGKKIGIEIPRNELDGSFTSESVTESLRVVMVSEEGEVFRKNAKQMRDVFGSAILMDSYLDSFIGYLAAYRSV
ncbi:hypothetical protein ACHQM5_023654 [Ranunculus cassubicifolius]